MKTPSYKTVFANSATAKKGWVLIDAQNEYVGRVASRVAYILRGKNKTSFTPNTDTGDNVIIINAEKVLFSGNKMEDKEYLRYTGYPGGQRSSTPKELLRKSNKSTEILRHAVHGMLPKSRLGEALKRNLFIYEGSQHPHDAQQPKAVKLISIK